MKHIQTLETRDMAKSLRDGGCGECRDLLPERLQDQLRPLPTSPARKRTTDFSHQRWRSCRAPYGPGISFASKGATVAHG